MRHTISGFRSIPGEANLNAAISTLPVADGP
jgi:hypothetical protein